MNIETFRNFCITKKGVTEEFPFDKNALVHKVMGKMFVLTDLDPIYQYQFEMRSGSRSGAARAVFRVQPGYHMPAYRSVGISVRRYE